MPIHGWTLQLPLSHALPRYLKDHSQYDWLLTRVSDYVARTHGRLNCIDVGADIGDSIAALVRVFTAVASTASLTIATHGESVQPSTLDQIVDEYPEFRNANVVKIDTDGHESFTLYDSVGYLLGRFKLAELQLFADLLCYEWARPSFYYDVVLMREAELTPFFESERRYYLARCAKPRCA